MITLRNSFAVVGSLLRRRFVEVATGVVLVFVTFDLAVGRQLARTESNRILAEDAASGSVCSVGELDTDGDGRVDCFALQVLSGISKRRVVIGADELGSTFCRLLDESGSARMSIVLSDSGSSLAMRGSAAEAPSEGEGAFSLDVFGGSSRMTFGSTGKKSPSSNPNPIRSDAVRILFESGVDRASIKLINDNGEPEHVLEVN